MAFIGRTPSGDVTTDIDKYGAEWKSLGDAIAHKLGAQIVGCDPFIALKPLGDAGPVVQLPLWAVQRILAL